MITRRSLLRSSAVGAGLTVLAGISVSLRVAGAGQIEVEPPPPATPGATTPAGITPLGPTIASKAAELNFDQEAITRFVQEDVLYEPYAGGLRGELGTLWSLSGNSVDKSILLSALLSESLVTHRFAVGRLAPGQVEALNAFATVTSEGLRQNAQRAYVESIAPTTFGMLDASVSDPNATPLPITPADHELIQQEEEAGAQQLELAVAMANRNVNQITGALRQNGVTLDQPTAVVPQLEGERFVWIQIADGPVWIDAFPVTLGGETPVPETTFAELPEEFFHQVDIKLFSEEVAGGALSRRELVRLYGVSSSLINRPIGILVSPPEDFASLGLGINQLFSGDVSLVPYMFAGDVVVYSDAPVVFGSQEEGILGALGEDSSGLGEGESLALWLDIVSTSPTGEQVHIERALMDRIGPEARLRGVNLADPSFQESLAPLTFVEFLDGTPVPQELAAVHLLTGDVGRIPFTYALNDSASFNTYLDSILVAPGMSAFRDGLRLQLELERGATSIVDRLQLTMFSISMGIEPDGSETAEIAIDLLAHHRATAPIAGSATAGDVHPAVLAGVLSHVAEAQLINLFDEEIGTESISTAKIFDLAEEQGIDVALVRDAAGLSRLELSAGSLSRIEQRIAEGAYVLAPAAPVELNGARRAGWWLIDGATGYVRDELDNGTGGVSLVMGASRFGSLLPGIPDIRFSEATERSLLQRISDTASKAFKRVGCAVRTPLKVASLVLTVYGSAASSDATAAKNVAQYLVTEQADRGRRAAKAARDAAEKAGGSC
jgi:hypothetical protein